MAKKKSLIRLTESLYNTPHLVSSNTFNIVMSYLDLRNAGLDSSTTVVPVSGAEDEEEDEYIVDGIGVIEIHGAMTYKPVEGMCGEVDGCSYEGILEDFEELIDEGATTIVMDIASGGGQGSHVFEYITEVRKLCDENDIQLFAYIDECACSAAYAWACIADEVIINPSGEAGSIGVLIALMDTSKAMEKMGVKRIFITAGEEKVPFAADGSFKQSFLDDLQAQVDKLGAQFVNHVAQYTGLSPETILGFQAKCFDAEESLQNGLVNNIMTKSEFAAYVAAKHKVKQTGAM